jgi:phytoene dehydrogenase-like protein
MPDAIVIGAGHNGLVAAAYLARAGLAVEVLERRDVVGGACVTEELWPGVRASPGAYTLSLLRRRIIDDLGLHRHGLRVDVHEPYLFAPTRDGRRVVTWSSPERTHAQLARDWSPADADAYAHRARRWATAAARARPLMLEAPARERWLEAVGPAILDGSIADDVAGIPSEEVRVPFALQGLIGTLAGPEDAGTAFVAFFHELGEATEPGGRDGVWGFARGGMGAVTGALRASAEAAGARVRTESPVARVLRDDRTGAAAGVVLDDGAELAARVVLSNADPVRTAALAGEPPPRGWRQAGPVVKVMVLLDGLPDFPAWPGPEAWRGAIDIGFTLDDLAAAAADARAGRPAARPWIEAACQTAADPTLAPAGRHVLSLFCQCFPPDADAGAAADAAIARFAEACPGLPDRIIDRLALGPRELEERFGLTGGHIFHGEMTGGQLLEGRFGPRAFAGVAGLYLAGSGAHPGGAVTGAPGYLAARAVLEDLAWPAAHPEPFAGRRRIARR